MAGAALAVLAALVVVAAPRAESAAACSKNEINIGIVKATGCFVERQVPGQGPVYDSSATFTMSGFKVDPRAGGKVTFSPPEGKRAGTVSTTGSVDLSAANATFGTIRFNGISFAFAPPKSGEVVLAESALVQPLPAVTGLTPLSVTQPIRLTEDGAAFDLNFGLEGVFKTLVTGREKELSFRVGFKVADGKWRLGGGGVTIRQIELAKLLAVKEASIQFDTPSNVDVDIDAGFKGLEGRGLLAGFSLKDGKPTRLKLGLSGLNAQLGTSGIYLQKLGGELFIAPPYGGTGLIGLSAGPKQAFLGRDVTAVEADGSVTFRSSDPSTGAPGFFRVGGNVSILSMPVGDASFGYRIGQGTDFTASVGIGLPCACNRSSEPTYLGGRFSGWTAARTFDLEGQAKLKVLGINLLGAHAVLSDFGMAGCVRIIAWIGGGVRWSNGRGEMLGGWTCNIGGYKRSPSTRAAAEDDGSTPLRLDADVRIVRFTAPAGEDAPDVEIEDRDGNVLETPEADDPNGVLRLDEGASLADDAGMSAFILPADSPRRWTLTEHEGSSEIETIEYAERAPDHEVEAEVVGKGRDRTLRWSSADLPFQRLQFSEVLPSGREVPILETDDAVGEEDFTPVEGVGAWGERKLAVDVMARLNTPRDELIADTYAVERLPAPRRARRLHASDRLNDVIARWQRVAGAEKYVVTARAVGTGSAFSKTVSGELRRARLLDVGTGNRLRVSVRGLNAQGRAGRPSIVTLKADDGVDSRTESIHRQLGSLAAAPSGSLATRATCPAVGYCYGRIELSRRGRSLGTASFELPAAMSDRVAIKPPERVRRRLASGGSIPNVRVEVSLRQVEGSDRVVVRRTLRAGRRG